MSDNPAGEANEAAWDAQRLADPHAAPDKAERVEAMFAAIARRYDLNNRLHSFGRDQAWRRAAVRMAELQGGETVADVACGTGDLAMAFADALARRPVGEHREERHDEDAGGVIGLDFTQQMLDIAERKRRGRRITYRRADAMDLPLNDASVDVVSIAFGIRNVADPARALAEFRRVLRPGGRLIVLEFSEPRSPVIRGLDRFYRHRVMPLTATLIAGDRSGAYRYLPRSVATFLDSEALRSALSDAGFERIATKSLTLGVAAVHRGVVPQKA